MESVLVWLLICLGAGELLVQARDPLEPIPSGTELEWQKLGYYTFAHFDPNTFTDKEWRGKEDPNLFNPADFDARQWARMFRKEY